MMSETSVPPSAITDRLLQFGLRVFLCSLSCRAAEPEAASEGTEACCPVLFWAGAAMQG